HWKAVSLKCVCAPLAWLPALFCQSFVVGGGDPRWTNPDDHVGAASSLSRTAPTCSRWTNGNVALWTWLAWAIR
ncbi:unnamed protein product, partial [Ectocarpus fasciculatus]